MCIHGAPAVLRLNAIARSAAREPGPLVTFVLCLTVAKVDSIGFRNWYESAGAAGSVGCPAFGRAGSWHTVRPSGGSGGLQIQLPTWAMIAVIVGWSILGAWRMMTRDA